MKSTLEELGVITSLYMPPLDLKNNHKHRWANYNFHIFKSKQNFKYFNELSLSAIVYN